MLCFPMLISSLPSANLLLLEHKIGVFVRFCPSEPSFSGVSSTKSRFLCAFALRNPRFRAFRAQKRAFCALLVNFPQVLAPPEHKIGIFVLGKSGKWHREAKRGGACHIRDFLQFTAHTSKTQMSYNQTINF